LFLSVVLVFHVLCVPFVLGSSFQRLATLVTQEFGEPSTTCTYKESSQSLCLPCKRAREREREEERERGGREREGDGERWRQRERGRREVQWRRVRADFSPTLTEPQLLTSVSLSVGALRD